MATRVSPHFIVIFWKPVESPVLVSFACFGFEPESPEQTQEENALFLIWISASIICGNFPLDNAAENQQFQKDIAAGRGIEAGICAAGMATFLSAVLVLTTDFGKALT